MPAAVFVVDQSTTAARMPGSDSGRTPWPRLKTWPRARLAVRSALGEHGAGGLRDDGPRRQAERGVEVALQRVARRHAGAPRRGGRASRRRRRRIRPYPSAPSSSPVPTPKRIVGTPRSAMPSSTARVAGRAKRAYSPGESEPAQLSKSCTACGAGLDLGPEEGHRHRGQPLGQLVPELGVAVHQGLDPRRSSRDGPPSTSVARHGEGRAGEADQRHARPLQLPARPGAPSRRRRARRPPARRAAGGPGRPRCERARPQPGPGQAPRRRRSRWRVGHDDVGEQDGGVHAVAADRLQRELGRERGVADGGEDGARRRVPPGTRAARAPPGA